MAKMSVEEKKTSRRRAISLSVPQRFKSESEEAGWWYENRALIETLLDQHGRRVDGNVEIEVELKPAKLISIRLPEADIASARRLAARKGMRYQSYLRALVHEGLAAAERKKSDR